MVTETKYAKKHNKISQYVHWCMLQDYNLPVNMYLNKNKPKPAVQISTKIMLNYIMTQEVDHVVEANRPNIVLLNEKEKTTILIDVTIPMDINVVNGAELFVMSTRIVIHTLPECQ
eukprot:13304571-Ditylum_brightwellii.AAC.1